MNARRYAEGTTVPAESSRAEISKLLIRRGADQIITGWDAERGSFVQFRLTGRFARLSVPVPDPERLVERYPNARRSVDDLSAAEERRAWRALVLLIKAKLEAIDADVSTFEKEFLSDLLLPDGKVVGDYVGPALEQAYATGRVRALLPAWGGDE